MVTSQEKTVDEYFATLSGDRLSALTKLRALCQQTLRGFTETMDYGMPCYKRSDVVEVAFNSQKSYISLYIDPEIVKAHSKLLKGLQCGKSCIRYKKVDQIDFDAVKQLLSAVQKSKSSGVCS